MPRNRDRLYVTSCEFALWATKGKGWTFNRQRDTYENTIFTYPIVGSKERIHPTQKPVKLMEDIIKIHTKENDLILDPFMGSGSTAIAAINTGRKYIGFELDENYYRLSCERIKKIA
jgi:DNA modification methylase